MSPVDELTQAELDLSPLMAPLRIKGRTIPTRFVMPGMSGRLCLSERKAPGCESWISISPPAACTASTQAVQPSSVAWFSRGKRDSQIDDG